MNKFILLIRTLVKQLNVPCENHRCAPCQGYFGKVHCDDIVVMWYRIRLMLPNEFPLEWSDETIAAGWSKDLLASRTWLLKGLGLKARQLAHKA